MNKKIRIIEVNKAYFPHTGGIETLVKQYSQDLQKNGFESNSYHAGKSLGFTYGNC